MRDNFDNCFAITMGSEGSEWDRNPKDRGNWTSGKVGVGELKGSRYGIAAFVYPTVDIEHLTRDGAKAIYLRDYAPKVAFDLQPIGPDLVAWDICVNSGEGRSLKIEGEALATDERRPSALAIKASGYPDKVGLIKRMCAARASFYNRLANSSANYAVSRKGWLRRNATMEAQGVRMAVGATGATPDKQKEVLNKEAKSASKTATSHAGGAATTGAGSAAGGSQSSPDQWGLDWATAGKVALAAVAVILIIYFIRQYIVHRERSAAYTAAAAGIVK